MKRILLVKLTSLGDLIHALPALSDAHRFDSEIAFDWVVDAHFQEVATWHRAVSEIIPTNHRKWRKALFRLSTLREIGATVRRIRKKKYDLIIDGQGNFKSALLTRLAKGVRCGYDRHSARESIAHLAYNKEFGVSLKSHAIDRLRKLFALSLGYPIPTSPPDFQIRRDRFIRPDLELPSSYFVFIPNAAWETKLWPEERWIELIQKMEGHSILLPWGNEREKGRALRLAAGNPSVVVLPKLSLSEIGYILAGATACVSMDTGLSHLASALEIPSITLYGATDSGLIGTCGKNQVQIQSKMACAPCHKKKCAFPSNGLNPPCLGQITPERVFQKLSELFVAHS